MKRSHRSIVERTFFFAVGELKPKFINANFAGSQNTETSVATMIQEYTKDKRNVKLTIGVLKEGKTNFKVFGAGSKELEPVEYEYEIGSISKTFTTSILFKAIDDGLINLNDPISKYLPLDSDTFYPAVSSLAIHTSGYGEYPFSASKLSQEELKKTDYDFYEKDEHISGNQSYKHARYDKNTCFERRSL